MLARTRLRCGDRKHETQVNKDGGENEKYQNIIKRRIRRNSMVIHKTGKGNC